MANLPLNHYRHLKRLADLRRCSVTEAVDYLMAHVDPVSRNWLDDRYGVPNEERAINVGKHDIDLVIRKIQGLPKNIRPVTDGPYLDEFTFFSGQQGLIGINADGVRILDFETVSARDASVFPLVKDLLPPMSLEQFHVYNTFNSQYLRLVRQPKLFTMPKTKAPAIDAGCYVGYKALAMARSTGGAPVLAFELDSDNFAVLQQNVANNPQFQVEAIRAALSDQTKNVTIHTRNERTMAHSLTNFHQLKEANTALLDGGQENKEGHEVQTTLLDSYTREIKTISAVHVSVNGHEPEVVRGGIQTAKRSSILRVSCPYSRDNRPVREMVIEAFTSNGINVFGISGAAVIAGTELGDYHVTPAS